MVEFFLGKTGGGKSLLALKRIVEFLAEYADGIVRTNLSIDKGKLNAWMKLKYPDREPDVVGRVHLLTDDQCRQFYLHREPGNSLQPVTKQQEAQLQFPDFDGAAMKSVHVLYIIDEAHIFFDSREWAQVGPTLNFFASQHRKFRSDIIFITQFLDQVEKRLRNHATSFSECQNWGLRRVSLWKMPGYFRVRLTYKAPPCPSEHTDTYSIDVSLANCYDTTAGVGVKGGRAPERKRQKGWPFWTLPALILVGVGLVFYLPDVLLKFGLSRLNVSDKYLPPDPSKPGAKAAAGAVALAPVVPGGAALPHPATIEPFTAQYVSTPVRPISGLPALHKEALRVVGTVVRGRQSIVVLSDGRRITESEPGYGGIDRRGTGVWLDGQKVYMANPMIPPKPVVKVVQVADEEGAIVHGSPYQGESITPTADSAKRSEKASDVPAIKQPMPPMNGRAARRSGP